MVWPLIVARGALTAGSWLLRGGSKLMTSKVTGSTLVAASVAKPGLSAVDGLTGHALSEALLKTPFGPALEAVLSVSEWSSEQKANVVANLIENKLVETGKMNPDSRDYARSQKLVKGFSYIVTGDMIGAGSELSGTGLNPSDVLSAYNDAKANNPDATMAEIGELAFVQLNNDMRQNALGVQSAGAGSAHKSSVGLGVVAAGVGAPAIGSAFEQAADKGFMGLVKKVYSFFKGLFDQGNDIIARGKELMKSMITPGDSEMSGNLNFAGLGGNDFTPEHNGPQRTLDAN